MDTKRYAIQLSARYQGREFTGYFAGKDFIGITQVSFDSSKPYREYTILEAAETVAAKDISKYYRKAVIDLETGKIVSRYIVSKQTWKRYPNS